MPNRSHHVIRLMRPNRYERQALAGWSQRRIANSMAVVVGAGATGNEVIKNLALIGVGRILVIDFDHVSPSNLTRCVLLRDEDVGHPKAEAVCRRVIDLNPDVKVRPVVGDIEFDLGESYLEDADIVIGCVDNIGARFALNRRMRSLRRTWIDGAISADAIQVSAFTPSGACYACGMTDFARRRLAERHSCTGFRRVTSTAPVPTTAITSSLCGGLLAHVAVEALHDRRPLDGSRWTLMLPSTRWMVDRLTPSVECPFHPRRVRRRMATLESGPEASWRDVIRELGLTEDAQLLPGDGLIEALSCMSCGAKRIQVSRRSRLPVELSLCDHCGQQTRPHLVQSIDSSHRLAQVPLVELGYVDGGRVTMVDQGRLCVLGLRSKNEWSGGRGE